MTLTPEDEMRHPKPLKKLPRDCLGNIRSKNFGLELICGQAKEKSEKLSREALHVISIAVSQADIDIVHSYSR